MLRGLAVLLLCSLTIDAQDRANWQSLGQLHPGDRITVALKTQGSPSVSKRNGIFQSWDQDQINLDSATVLKTDVATVSRYRKGGWGRGKTALLGAGIGGAVGAGVGVGIGGNCGYSIGPCITRGEGGAVFGGIGALLGAITGALIPHHHRADIIYAAERIQNATP